MSTTAAIAFLAASVLFIVGIKLLSSPKTARRGNLVAGAGMAFANRAQKKAGGEA